jgi:hypothetical protein
MKSRIKKRKIISKASVKRVKVFSVSLLLILLLSPLKLFAEYIYERVILDENYRNNNSMTLNEIKEFMEGKGSWLTNFLIPTNENVPYPSLEDGEVIIKYTNSIQVDMEGKSIAGQKIPDLIYNYGQKYELNPQVVIVMIQKESSAITQTTPSSESRRYWTMFYGYNETIEACRNCVEGNPKWNSNCTNPSYLEEKCGEPDYWKSRAQDYGGTGKQIARAIWYLDSRFENAKNPSSWYYYKDPVNIDGVNVTCENPSTRVLYLYTPHKQTTFFNIYTSYWGLEPNVMQANDTNPYEKSTYLDNHTLGSHKSIEARAYLGTSMIADYGPDKWSATVEGLQVGMNNPKIEYREMDGKREYKNVYINRHKKADINGDDQINTRDLLLLTQNWGREEPEEYMANINQDVDTVVDAKDLSILASQWGK